MPSVPHRGVVHTTGLILFRVIGAAIVFLSMVVQAGCAGDRGSRRMPHEPGPALTANEVADNMLWSIGSTPVLRVEADIETDGEVYHSEAWMSATKFRSEVRRDGRLIYASFVSEGRMQEFYPMATVAKDIALTNVLIEYDGPESTGGWPVFQTSGFGCDVVGVIGESWLDPNSSAQQVMTQNLRTATMSVDQFEGRPCYVFQHERRRNALDVDIVEERIDQETFEPVLVTRTEFKGVDMTVKRNTYRFTHLKDESGIEWTLDAAKLRNAADPETIQIDATPAKE